LKKIISRGNGYEVTQNEIFCYTNILTSEFIDEIINHADEKMYSEKRIIKKNLKVIRG